MAGRVKSGSDTIGFIDSYQFELDLSIMNAFPLAARAGGRLFLAHYIPKSEVGPSNFTVQDVGKS